MNDKLKGLRSTLNDTVFQENHFTEKSRQIVFERIQKSKESPFRFIKRFVHLIKRPMISVIGTLVLCSALFFIIQNEFWKQETTPSESDTGETDKPNETIDPEKDTDIPFEIYFQGFIVQSSQKELPPGKLMVFTNVEEWASFYEKYVYLGQWRASMDRSIDWKQEYLIYNPSRIGAKPGFTTGTRFLGYELNGDQLFPLYEEQGGEPIVAVFDDTESLATFHVWTIVKKEDLPEKIVNNYKPTK